MHYAGRSIIADIVAEGSDTTVVTVDTAGRAPSGSPAQRRRGATLEQAILAAAFAELCDVGYGAFSVENVAARARTGKASIYRRWPAKPELVLDALIAELPSPCDVGLSPQDRLDDSVTTTQALHLVGETIARIMTSPAGAAMRSVKLEAVGDRRLADLIDERFQAPRREALLGILRRGVARGEVRPDAATPVVADVLPALLLHRILVHDAPIEASDVQDAIALVMIPLVAAHRSP